MKKGEDGAQGNERLPSVRAAQPANRREARELDLDPEFALLVAVLRRAIKDAMSSNKSLDANEAMRFLHDFAPNLAEKCYEKLQASMDMGAGGRGGSNLYRLSRKTAWVAARTQPRNGLGG